MKFTISKAEYMIDQNIPSSISIDTSIIISCKKDNESFELTFLNGSVCKILILDNYDHDLHDELKYYQIQYYPKEYDCEYETDDPFYLIYFYLEDEKILDLLNDLERFI
jgi:hypothetical protein